MKSLIALLVLGFSLSTQAAPSTFSCSNVGGTAEWTIYIDLTKKVAGFFDNDSTVTVPLKQVLSLESMPPQTEYHFEGADQGGGKNAKLHIIFNITRMTGHVVFIDSKGKSEDMRAEDGCSADNSINL